MAAKNNPNCDFLIVPQGNKPLPEAFLNFLWDREIPAFLTEHEFVGQQESGQTGLGLSIAPGTC
jgi:hypothetical protein